MENEQEQFLKSTEQGKELDVLDQPLVPEGTSGQEAGKQGDGEGNEDDGKEGLKPRNRRERRLMEKLGAERESSAFLAGKLEARTEAGRAVSEESDYLKSVERIYGTDTPEAQIATDLLKKAITGAKDEAKREAIEFMKEEREKEQAQLRKADDELDAMIDEIEDEHGVTLTDAQQRSYFQLLEKMSPKDADGNVKEYADAGAVWEVFQEKLQKKGTDTRAKDMSARSMTQSGASRESNLNDDVNARFLRESGII